MTKLSDAEALYERKVQISVCGAIGFARRRQERKLSQGKPFVKVTITKAQVLKMVEEQNFRCALTGLKFYSLSGGGFGPSCPSLDRIRHAGPYSAGNLRVVLTGVNSLRGNGSDADMYAVAKALTRKNRPSSVQRT
jgi:hypothetical protein